MSNPEESQPTLDRNEPSLPVTPDYHERLSKIETDIAKILAIIEPPHLAQIEREKQEAEAARDLAEAYASGDIGHVSG